MRLYFILRYPLSALLAGGLFATTVLIAILIKPLVAAFGGFCGCLYSGFPIEGRNIIG